MPANLNFKIFVRLFGGPGGVLGNLGSDPDMFWVRSEERLDILEACCRKRRSHEAEKTMLDQRTHAFGFRCSPPGLCGYYITNALGTFAGVRGGLTRGLWRVGPSTVVLMFIVLEYGGFALIR